MKLWGEAFQRVDRRLTGWMAKNSIKLLRISTGIIFTWFGVLKYFPGLSPAEGIAADTIRLLSFGIVETRVSMVILATWETLIGLGLISGIFLREVLLLLFLQMIGTIAPIFIFPERVFRNLPFVLTLEGQYIFKNLVLISAAFVIGATVRGGFLVSEPHNPKEDNLTK